MLTFLRAQNMIAFGLILSVLFINHGSLRWPTLDHFWSKKPATLLKVTLLHGRFARILNCTNGIKSRNASHMYYWEYLILWNLEKENQRWFFTSIYSIFSVMVAIHFFKNSEDSNELIHKNRQNIILRSIRLILP